MSDKVLKPHGVVEPKSTTWLKEVRLDAARNTIEQLRQQKDAQEFQLAKARGITTEEIIAKGKEDLNDSPVVEEVVEPQVETKVETKEETPKEPPVVETKKGNK
jgi:hypothetical protein